MNKEGGKKMRKERLIPFLGIIFITGLLLLPKSIYAEGPWQPPENVLKNLFRQSQEAIQKAQENEGFYSSTGVKNEEVEGDSWQPINETIGKIFKEFQENIRGPLLKGETLPNTEPTTLHQVNHNGKQYAYDEEGNIYDEEGNPAYTYGDYDPETGTGNIYDLDGNKVGEYYDDGSYVVNGRRGTYTDDAPALEDLSSVEHNGETYHYDKYGNIYDDEGNVAYNYGNYDPETGIGDIYDLDGNKVGEYYDDGSYVVNGERGTYTDDAPALEDLNTATFQGKTYYWDEYGNVFDENGNLVFSYDEEGNIYLRRTFFGLPLPDKKVKVGHWYDDGTFEIWGEEGTYTVAD